MRAHTSDSAGKTLAASAFLFFFIKGLLWLLIPGAIYLWGC